MTDDYDRQADDSWIPRGWGAVWAVGAGIVAWAVLVALSALLGLIVG